MENERFEAFPDPFDNWMVWDLEEDGLAESAPGDYILFRKSVLALFAAC